ncbi:MAG: hypothetical protein FJ398_08140 [Verrucomicrobia bacterium]|nr:hypothetical protein [Verrucomicrobiota bacterium]
MGAAWFATAHGVTRFDGRQFKTLSRVDGLLDDSVLSLCETRDGSLWVGSASGANRIKEGRITTYAATNGLAGGEIFHIEQGPDGRIWFRTREGLCFFDGQRFQSVPGVSRIEDSLFTFWRNKPLAVAPNGMVWVVTKDRGELAQWDGQTMKPVAADLIRTNDWIDTLHFDRKGRLWFQLGTRG